MSEPYGVYVPMLHMWVCPICRWRWEEVLPSCPNCNLL